MKPNVTGFGRDMILLDTNQQAGIAFWTYRKHQHWVISDLDGKVVQMGPTGCPTCNPKGIGRTAFICWCRKVEFNGKLYPAQEFSGVWNWFDATQRRTGAQP
tara:strand:- start:124 stop:429 length:306 start_codon:yes stop_codon:yes gene_type:complete